ncbi:unnamed protein product [Larinioides sclopetarius]|uniref:Uncharacterized protein n=1 Tax=Larinioides sclopetarius TaxID=280406 RepID=A0AAV2BDW3_9ARAC
MPCSCGNMTCPCGIPCYCLEESCKCRACALAVHRFCKICNKPLITDIQTDKDACFCFVGESTASILQKEKNPKFRMGNIPLPVSYFAYGNVVIPVLNRQQIILEGPVSLMTPSLSAQKDSGKILPSFISDLDVATPFSSGKDAGILSTAESNQLDKFGGQSVYHASSSFSTGAQNIETDPSFILKSANEKTAHLVGNTKSETEGRIPVQESSLYSPSIGIDNISYPVGMTDPVLRSSNPAFCVADGSYSSLKLCNTFYVAGPVHTMTDFEKECHKPASSLNFDSNNLAQGETVTILQMNEQPLGPTKITGHSDLEIHGQREKFEDSLNIAEEKKFTVFPSARNSNGIGLTEQWGQRAFNSLRSNEISENYLMHETSSDISPSGIREFAVQSKPVCAVSTFGSGNDGCLQACPVNCSIARSVSNTELQQNGNFWCPHQISSNTQNIPEYFGAPNISSKPQPMFNKRSDQSSKEIEDAEIGNASCVLINDERNEEIDPIPLYIDTSTTLKMGKILNSVKHSNVSSSIFVDAASSM